MCVRVNVVCVCVNEKVCVFPTSKSSGVESSLFRDLEHT